MLFNILCSKMGAKYNINDIPQVLKNNRQTTERLYILNTITYYV